MAKSVVFHLKQFDAIEFVLVKPTSFHTRVQTVTSGLLRGQMTKRYWKRDHCYFTIDLGEYFTQYSLHNYPLNVRKLCGIT